jgi:hypothetical protein
VRTEKEKKNIGTKKEMKKKNARRTLRTIKLEMEMYLSSLLPCYARTILCLFKLLTRLRKLFIRKIK